MAGRCDHLTGGCLCGAIRFVCAELPCDVHYCHCRVCQKAFGNVFAVFGSLPRSALRFTRGTLQHYRSTPYAERGFCRDCGTPLTFAYLRSDWIAIAIGSLDQPALVRPEKHWGIESQVPWLALHDGLPRAPIEGEPDYMAWRRADAQPDSITAHSCGTRP